MYSGFMYFEVYLNKEQWSLRDVTAKPRSLFLRIEDLTARCHKKYGGKPEIYLSDADTLASACITRAVHPKICILNQCELDRRSFRGGPFDMPEKGVFSLAALTAVHLAGVRVSGLALSIQATDLSKQARFS
jgi:hypothetical protein